MIFREQMEKEEQLPLEEKESLEQKREEQKEEQKGKQEIKESNEKEAKKEIKGEEVKETKEEKEAKDAYTKALKTIFDKLNTSSLDWRLVGGTALNFYLGKVPSPYRSNGTVRDLDIIVLNEKPDEVKEMNKFFRKEMIEFNKTYDKTPVYPQVDFTPVKNKDYLKKSKKNPIPQIMTHILRDGSRFFLQFRDILEEINPQVLEPYWLEIKTGKETFKAKSVNPQTLLHLYLSRLGYIKPKDVEKLKNFLRELKKKNIEEGENHNLYLPFHRFARRVRKKYKITTKALQFYTLIDHKLFNSALTHKIIPDKILKIFLDN